MNVLGVCRSARDFAKVVDQVRFLARTLTGSETDGVTAGRAARRRANRTCRVRADRKNGPVPFCPRFLAGTLSVWLPQPADWRRSLRGPSLAGSTPAGGFLRCRALLLPEAGPPPESPSNGRPPAGWGLFPTGFPAGTRWKRRLSPERQVESGSNPEAATAWESRVVPTRPTAPSFQDAPTEGRRCFPRPRPGRTDRTIRPRWMGHRERCPAGDGSRIHPVPMNRASTIRETVSPPFAEADRPPRGLEDARRSRHRWMLKSPPRRVAAGSNALSLLGFATSFSWIAPPGEDPRPVWSLQRVASWGSPRKPVDPTQSSNPESRSCTRIEYPASFSSRPG